MGKGFSLFGIAEPVRSRSTARAGGSSEDDAPSGTQRWRTDREFEGERGNGKV